MNHQTAEKLADRNAFAIEQGLIKRDSLTNHGNNFTGCGEQIALKKYIDYISSASYFMADLIEKGALNNE